MNYKVSKVTVMLFQCDNISTRGSGAQPQLGSGQREWRPAEDCRRRKTVLWSGSKPLGPSSIQFPTYYRLHLTEHMAYHFFMKITIC